MKSAASLTPSRHMRSAVYPQESPCQSIRPAAIQTGSHRKLERAYVNCSWAHQQQRNSKSEDGQGFRGNRKTNTPAGMNVMASNAESSSGLDSILYRAVAGCQTVVQEGLVSDVVLGAATLLLWLMQVMAAVAIS
ncbi:hypothetical protein Nepgr_024748 [Nepenthes gracilis]|uniref:Uncharacterized protein n=1 Tax=Nepenthes gracilis TaxID=150966 RepID=A0AAD3Y0D1_NEPGR|nr:hypothetical protein Nepgr_024748 [Nepenthes gracilis]